MRFIYQSPKTKLRSSPIDESNDQVRGWLEAKGWKIVDRLGDLQAPKLPAPLPPPEPAPEPDGVALPEGFPHRDALIAAGFGTIEAVRAAKGLAKTKGIGPGRVKAIYEALA